METTRRDITRRDVEHQVAHTVDEDYDLRGIVDAIVERYGFVDIDQIDPAEYWRIVDAHQLPPAPSPAEIFKTGMIAAIMAAEIGQPAVWHGDHAAVEIARPSRVRHTWPQPWAQVTIITPDGTRTEIDGADIESWTDLWDRIEDAVDQWRAEVDISLHAVQAAHRRLERAEAEMLRARAARDAAVCDAARRGVTAYRMAHALGVAESTVGRIIGKAQ